MSKLLETTSLKAAPAWSTFESKARMAEDPVDPRVRAVEREIDSFYLSSPIIARPFPFAAWYTLALTEDELFIRELGGLLSDRLDYHAHISDQKFVVKNAMTWVLRSCPPLGGVPATYDEQAAMDASALIELAREYIPFVGAFSYASQGIGYLAIEGNRILFSDDLIRDAPYQAYDTMMSATVGIEGATKASVRLSRVPDLLDRSASVREGRIHVDFNSRLVRLMSEFLAAAFHPAFELPGNWNFRRYNLGSFRAVFIALGSMAASHHMARVRFGRAVPGAGFMDSLVLMPANELTDVLVRLSGVSREIVRQVVRDLTLGAHGLELPDPALQPLVELEHNLYGLTPFLITTSTAERNLITLINRIPAERELYLTLVGGKEDLMRKHLIRGVRMPTWRTVFGAIPGADELPDVDLAFVDDNLKVCIVIELKWFIEPAEAREVIQRSNEIRNGIGQLQRLRDACVRADPRLLGLLKVNKAYRAGYLVLSANSIGGLWVQDETVPVVQHDHFLRKVRTGISMPDLLDWLELRTYLPIKGRHFELQLDDHRIGNWLLRWHGLKLLTSDLPL